LAGLARGAKFIVPALRPPFVLGIPATREREGAVFHVAMTMFT
jgi:hypothetical protein